MNRKFARIVSTLVCISLIGSLFAGCGKKEQKVETKPETKTEGQVEQQVGTYPIKSNETLTYWVTLNSNVTAHSPSLNETEFAKELMKKTGINVKFLHPTQGQEKEQFNLLIASGDMPDIIDYNWLNFIGGPDKAINDGYILKLNETIDKYAPNLNKFLNDNPDIMKQVRTDTGSMYMFPFIRGDELLLVYNGPMMRADWLKELNLEVPTTIEEWENVLKEFKDKKGASAPFSYEHSKTPNVGTLYWGSIIGAYGITYGYYIEDGKVKFGPMEPQYKEFLTTLNKWYKEGLLDKNFATVDGKILGSNILGGKTGATVGYNGGGLGKWMQAMKEKDPNFELVAVPYPTLKKGETPKFGQMDQKFTGIGSAITSKCKNVELAARFLDYGYTKEGIDLHNYGIENVSYTMVDNKPQYTDLIVNNPDKMTISQAMSKYMRTYSGPFIQQKDYILNFYQLQQQKDALQTWAKTDAAKYYLPAITPLPEESSELAKIDNEIFTYVDEMLFKFVMGAEPLSNFDKYIEQIKKMNVDKAIKIREDALVRFGKR